MSKRYITLSNEFELISNYDWTTPNTSGYQCFHITQYQNEDSMQVLLITTILVELLVICQNINSIPLMHRNVLSSKHISLVETILICHFLYHKVLIKHFGVEYIRYRKFLFHQLLANLYLIFAYSFQINIKSLKPLIFSQILTNFQH